MAHILWIGLPVLFVVEGCYIAIITELLRRKNMDVYYLSVQPLIRLVPGEPSGAMVLTFKQGISES